MSESRLIVERVFRKSYSKRLVTVEDAISLVAPTAIGCDQFEAEEYAKRNKRRIWNRVVERLDEEDRKGLYPTFEIVDPDRFELAWFPMQRRGDDARLRRKKMRLACRGEILNYIDTDEVDSRAYEALGCIICELAGASQWHLTPPGNEFGIDFLAVMPTFGRSHLFPHARKQTRIIGQSKKWNSPIGRDEVRLLADTLDDIRKESSPIFDSGILPSWFVSAKGLLIGCMVARTGAQSGGYHIANSHGIIMADSRDVAEIVCLSKRWDVGSGKDEVVSFLSDSIRDIPECVRFG